MRPRRRQPTRLPCAWDSPGKNTGVGCHFLLQCMKLKSERESLSRVRLLVTPWTAVHHVPPTMGFSRQEYWSGVPLPSLKSWLKTQHQKTKIMASGPITWWKVDGEKNENSDTLLFLAPKPLSYQGSPYGPAVSRLCIYLKIKQRKKKILLQKVMGTSVFIVAL